MPIYFTELTVLCASFGWLGALCGLFGASIWFPMLLSTATAYTVWLAKLPKIALALACVPLLFYALAAAKTAAENSFDLSLYLERAVMLRGTVVETKESEDTKRQSFIIVANKLVYPHSQPLSSKVQVLVKGQLSQSLSVGNYVEVKGKLELPREGLYPWSFQSRAFLKRKGVLSECAALASDVIVLSSTSNHSEASVAPGTALIEARRRIVEMHVDAIGTEMGNLLTSMVLGDQCVKLSEDEIEHFRKAGLSHLVAASGFNLTIVVALAYWAARFISHSRTLRSLAAIACIAVFVGLAGPSASVMRAAITGILLIGGAQLHRKMNFAAILSITLLITLLADPASAAEPGAQLSYAATFGLVYGCPVISQISSRLFAFKLLPQLVGAFLTETISAVLCAQLAVLPIQLSYFWQAGCMFLPANLLVSPLVAPVTVLGFVSSILIGIPQAPNFQIVVASCRLIDQCAAFPLRLIQMIANTLGSIQGATIAVGPSSPVLIAVYYLLLLLALRLTTRPQLRLIAVVCLIFAGVCLFWRPALSGPQIDIQPDRVTIVGCDRKAFSVGGTSSRRLSEKFCSYFGGRRETSDESEPAHCFDIALKNDDRAKIAFVPESMELSSKQLTSFDNPDLLIVECGQTKRMSIDVKALAQGIHAQHVLIVQKSFFARNRTYNHEPTLPTGVSEKLKGMHIYLEAGVTSYFIDIAAQQRPFRAEGQAF